MLYMLNISFYILALAFLPELYSAAYRTAFLAGPADEGIFLALRVSCGCFCLFLILLLFVFLFRVNYLFLFSLLCDPP